MKGWAENEEGGFTPFVRGGMAMKSMNSASEER